jgi:hypothetical protein
MNKKYFYLFFFSLVIFNYFAQIPVMNSIIGPQNVCSSPAPLVSFTTSASNSPTSYQWTISNPSVGVTIVNPTSAVTAINFPYSNNTYTIYCYATNGFGTSATTSFVVNIFETPSVTFSGANSFCQGSSTNLQASSTILMASPTISYSWTPSIGLDVTNQANVIANHSVTTTYTAIATKGFCSSSAAITVSVVICAGIKTNNPIENKQVTVYPNPNNGSFILKSNKAEKVFITNDLGQLIKTIFIAAEGEIPVNELKAGIYFVITPSTKLKIVVIN